MILTWLAIIAALVSDNIAFTMVAVFFLFLAVIALILRV